MADTHIGPVVQTDLYDISTFALRRRVEANLASASRELAEDWTTRFEEMVRQAYCDGLRDGFAQGVYAAHDEETVRDGEPDDD